MIDNIYVKYLTLPCRIHSLVVANKDMTYTIVLNDRLSHEQNLLSYQHELEHIHCGDYDKKCTADLIELIAHGKYEVFYGTV